MAENKVLMAMSGGIDSSVAAMLLREQGYVLEGATYRVYDQISESCMTREKGCCSVDSIFEARRMAADMGFPHHIIDLRREFHESVIANFIDEYLHGRTPNPCVVCNPVIKWGRMLEEADRLGCRYIATGHYARIGLTAQGRRYLRMGRDRAKDQTYFLWRLSQDALSRTLFPLGDLSKPEVRAIAAGHGYEKLSKKAESQEICFIPDNDYRRFLRDNVDGYEDRFPAGDYVDAEGRRLGTHSGFPNYTIGQRKGLGIALGEPRYVTRIDSDNNRVTLGSRKDLLVSVAYASDTNLMMDCDFDDGMPVYARVRYKSSAVPAAIFHEDGRRIRIEFDSPVESVAPGQSVVFYVGDEHDCVLGGAVLQ